MASSPASPIAGGECRLRVWSHGHVDCWCDGPAVYCSEDDDDRDVIRCAESGALLGYRAERYTPPSPQKETTMSTLEKVLHNRYFRAAVYAGVGYVVQHGITGGDVLIPALTAALMAVLGLIHHDTEPDDVPTSR